MTLGSVVPDHLPDLKPLHGPDEHRAAEQHHQKGSYRPADTAKGYVSEDIESDKNRVKWIEKMIQHTLRFAKFQGYIVSPDISQEQLVS
jgi:hypothetical protein